MRPYTQLYTEIGEWGWGYYFLSLVLMMLMHDAYFYWTHRWMHHKAIYQQVHSVHHASLKPSAWASFSFHPIESIIEAAILPLLVLFVPIHPMMLIWHLTFMTLTAVINHLGFEVLPRNSFGRFVGHWFITGSHHSQHHRFFNYNYGLFFTVWDRVCGTNHPSYDKVLDERLAPASSSQSLKTVSS